MAAIYLQLCITVHFASGNFQQTLKGDFKKTVFFAERNSDFKATNNFQKRFEKKATNVFLVSI